VHADHFTGMMNGEIETLVAVTGQLGSDAVVLANQHHWYMPCACRHDGTGNFRAGGVVPPHGVNSDDDPPVQTGRPLFLGGRDFLALVGTAGRAGTMRLFRLLALRTERQARSLQRIVSPAHITLRLGGFLLWDCHKRSFSLAGGTPADV